MNDLPLGLLFGLIAILVLLSAFFSGSETGMLSLNRYRLQHQSKNNHKPAKRAQALLEKPDRLISTILIGNNLVNNLAATLTTVIAIRIFGDDSYGIATATIILTLVLLVFGEITPKTIAALYPERIAFPASLILKYLQTIFYPAAWLLNQVTKPLLHSLGFDGDKKTHDQLSSEELRTIVDEAGSLIPMRHQYMLRNILDLESTTVKDIMVPRGEMFCIDLDDSEAEILGQLEKCEFTRVPVFRGNIDNIIGILHMRNLGKLLSTNNFSKEAFLNILREPIFSPENTDLHMQLINFQKEKRRISIVIDEYGTVLGLATLEDILEEIVGNFTSNFGINDDVMETLPDGSLLISGSTSIREINRQTGWNLPLEGPKTLSGLVLEHLESFPDALASVNINHYIIEMVDLEDNVVEKARVFPLTPPTGQTGHLFR